MHKDRIKIIEKFFLKKKAKLICSNLIFKKNQEALSENVISWAVRQEIDLKFKRTVSVEKGILYEEGIPVNDEGDADDCTHVRVDGSPDVFTHGS